MQATTRSRAEGSRVSAHSRDLPKRWKVSPEACFAVAGKGRRVDEREFFMRRTLRVVSTLGVLFALAGHARAEPIFDMSGKVALLDGALPGDVRVTIGIDLDRDGELNTFEVVLANVSADGAYDIGYEPKPDLSDLAFGRFVANLLVEYETRGFEALLDDGPLPVIARFERTGYSTLTKRFTTLTDLPSLDVVMVPLAPVHCADDTCMAPDGSVRITGFPGGTRIASAFSRAYDPSADQRIFPGTFTDSSNNLLISSGFVEVDLRDASGARITRLSSPVSVRFRVEPATWPALRDLDADSDRIEVPMYSFNETRSEWLPELPGELQAPDGTPLDERDFAAIQEGSYADPVFVAFDTYHFSTFNCDAPVSERGCVQGRLVTLEGEAVAGAQVSVDGVSYTGSAGTVFTGSDGYFAADVMKSELDGEDVDTDGRRGETFQARINVTGAIGVFTSEPFDTPFEQGSVGRNSSCRAPNCECLDLGDIQGEFELPRACEVSVSVVFSGKHLSGSGGPLASGEAVADAKVTGEMSGGPALPLDDALCGGASCNHGRADEDGVTTFVVPIVGDEPTISLKAEYAVEDGNDHHYYTGSLSVRGCSRDEASVSGEVEIEVDHASLGDIGDFIESLGPGPSVPSGSGGSGGSGGIIPGVDAPEFESPKAPGCSCELPGARPRSRSGLLAGLLVAMSAIARRRRRG
jgi:hypothetical protein